MKVLIINQPFIKDFCRTQRWPARSRGRVLRPPDWLAYATAVLRQDGNSIKLYDFPALDWSKDRIPALIRQHRPDAVILDSTTPSIFSDIDCGRMIKETSPGCHVFMVGAHASAEPESTLRSAAGAVDAVAIGEYDHTVRDLVRSPDDLRAVEGVAYLDGDQLVRTRPRPLIQDLDSLPFPAWDQLDLWRYFDGSKLYPYISVISGRGCPFGCEFCLWPQVMHGRGYRFRAPELVVDELEYDLALFPSLRWGEFFFEDDTFTVNEKRAAILCEEILRRGLKITWSVNSRVSLENLELMRLMKRAGCRELLVGFESGDEEMLDQMDKQASVDQARRFISLTRQAGIDVHGCFVLGFPGETEASMRRTLDFALSLDLHTLQFSAAVPFPGTAFYERVKRDGALKAKSWDDWLKDGEQASVIDLPGMPKGMVDRYVDEGLKSFYFRPGYMLRFLAETRSVTDLYRKLRGFFNYASYLVESRSGRRAGSVPLPGALKLEAKGEPR